MERFLVVVFNFPVAALALVAAGFALGWLARALRQLFLQPPRGGPSQ